MVSVNHAQIFLKLIAHNVNHQQHVLNVLCFTFYKVQQVIVLIAKTQLMEQDLIA